MDENSLESDNTGSTDISPQTTLASFVSSGLTFSTVLRKYTSFPSTASAKGSTINNLGTPYLPALVP
jgi:hypothetical protein